MYGTVELLSSPSRLNIHVFTLLRMSERLFKKRTCRKDTPATFCAIMHAAAFGLDASRRSEIQVYGYKVSDVTLLAIARSCCFLRLLLSGRKSGLQPGMKHILRIAALKAGEEGSELLYFL